MSTQDSSGQRNSDGILGGVRLRRVLSTVVLATAICSILWLAKSPDAVSGQNTPNATLSSCSASPSRADSGDSVTISARAKNTWSYNKFLYVKFKFYDSRQDYVVTLEAPGRMVQGNSSYTFSISTTAGIRYLPAGRNEVVCDLIWIDSDDEDIKQDHSGDGRNVSNAVVRVSAPTPTPRPTPSLPDLTVTDLTVDGSSSPSQFTVGDEVTIRAVVNNTGSGAAGSSRLAYDIGRSSPVRNIGEDRVKSLDPGESSRESLTYTFIDADVGTQRIWFHADFENRVEEEDETNTFKSSSFQVLSRPTSEPGQNTPNATLSSCSASPSRADSGDSVTISARAKNTWSYNKFLYVKFKFYDSRQDYVVTLEAPGRMVQGNSSYTFSISTTAGIRYLPAGRNEVVCDLIWIDSDDEDIKQDHSGDGRNVSNAVVRVSAPTPTPRPTPSLPDLTVTDLTVDGSSSPSQFTVGDEVTIRAVVSNTGSGAAGSSRLTYYIGRSFPDRKIGEDDVSSLNPGGNSSEFLTYTFTDADVGAQRIWVLADSDNVVEEEDETNTFGSSAFQVRSRPTSEPGQNTPNATLSSCSASPSRADNGDSVTISARARNTWSYDKFLYVKFKFYDSSRSNVGSLDASGRTVSGGSSYTFSISTTAGNRYLPAGRNEVVCDLIWIDSNEDDHRQDYSGPDRNVSNAVVRVSAPQDGRSSATTIHVGSTADGNIDTADDEDYFSFSANSGSTYTIETFLRSLEDSLLELRDSNGRRLEDNDDWGDGTRASRIEWTAQSSGTYYVVVKGYQDSTGTYLISLSVTSPPESPPDMQGRTAFSSNRDGNVEIYVMNADGSSVTRLTDNEAVDRGASWSPDGGRIAFESDRDGDYEIYVMNADGSDVTRLTENEAVDRGASWSPDGGRIAFYSDRDEGFEIYVMNADGSDVTRLTDNEAIDGGPSWSPDGGRIAFSSLRGESFEIYVMNADGSDQTRLTENEELDYSPSWSPDGRSIAFTSRRDGNDEIYVMNADGSDQTRLTENEEPDSSPDWSPDGRSIAFTSRRDGNYEIYVMNADGSGQTRLTENEEYDSSPSWSHRNGGATPPVPTTRDDHGNDRSSATAIRMGSIADGNIETTGDVDYFSFSADSGITYTIETFLHSLEDSLLELRDSNSRRLAYNDDWGGGTASRIEWTAQSSGTYYVVVKGYQHHTGTYQLLLSAASPPDRQGRIAFSSYRDGNWEIYVMNADGSGVTRITDNSADDRVPSWSP